RAASLIRRSLPSGVEPGDRKRIQRLPVLVRDHHLPPRPIALGHQLAVSEIAREQAPLLARGRFARELEPFRVVEGLIAVREMKIEASHDVPPRQKTHPWPRGSLIRRAEPTR